jgi:hypothetical protein
MSGLIRRHGAAAVLVLAGHASAGTIWVNPCGDDTWSGMDPTCAAPDGPKQTIQAAIDAAVDGDEVVLADTLYSGPGNTNLDFGGRLITVRSDSGNPSVCGIDGQNVNRAFTFTNQEDASAVVEGLTIRDCQAALGAGIYIFDSSPTISNCVFRWNLATDEGGAVYLEDSSSVITDCQFYENDAFRGGAVRIRFSTGVQVLNSFFELNTATANGGAINDDTSDLTAIRQCTMRFNSAITSKGGGLHLNSSTNVTVANCLFENNDADTGGGINAQNSTTLSEITNCTFVWNSATIQGGGVFHSLGATPVTNCIFWNNYDAGGADESGQIHVFGGSPVVNYSIVLGGWSGSGGLGNVPGPPLFAGTGYKLDRFSPGLDAGDNAAAIAAGLVIDLDGLPRFVDDTGVADTGAGTPPIVDMGAYERQEESGPITVTVPAGSSIQTAINDAYDGDTLEVEAGTYNETIDFGGKPLTVRSIGGMGVTEINGGFSGSVVTFASGEGPDSVLEGFTIADGGFTSHGGLDVGGGVFCLDSSPTLTDCAIIGHLLAERGGGVFIDNGSPSITGCFIEHNLATRGGGLYIASGNPVLTSCLVGSNDAVDGAGLYNEAGNPTIGSCNFQGNRADLKGGGVATDSAATITRCLFHANRCTFIGLNGFGGGVWAGGNNVVIASCVFRDNEASDSGGGIHFAASNIDVTNCTFHGNSSPMGGTACNGNGTLTNCILWGNDAPDYDGFGTVNHCDIEAGGPPGPGNISADPLFVDAINGDFHLLDGSPCIDAGNNAAPGLPAIDYDEEARVQHCRVDMGADETPYFLDCNTNGVGDACDLEDATSSDLDANKVPDECDDFVLNVTKDQFHATIADAIGAAAGGDLLVATPARFTAETAIDFDGVALTLASIVEFVQPAAGWYVLADGGGLAAPTGQDITLFGELRVLFGDRVDLAAETVTVEIGGVLTLETGAVTDVVAASGLTNLGAISMPGAALGVTGGLANGAGGTITGYGDIAADVINDGDATYQADTQLVGDYGNNGTTTVQNGTLTIAGTLTDNGTIVGDIAGGAAPMGAAPGLSVLGDYVAGADASLLMGGPATVTLGGHFDIAIDDHLRYDMADAQLRLIGLDQELELMSVDIGPDDAGLDRSVPGHYPVGTLRIEQTTVELVDDHDNDGQGQALCEAFYVQSLVVEAGATLVTGGCPVYYVTAQIAGDVDDPVNLVPIVVSPPCPWDLDGGGGVDVTDFLALLAAWGTNPGDPADFDGDGVVGTADFQVLLAHWGPCP